MITIKDLGRALMMAAGLSSMGCGVVDSTDDVESVDTAKEAVVWGNGDDPSFFWAGSTQSSLRSLAASALVSQSGELASSPLATTAAGRKLLTYVVGCAMPEGAELYSSVAGVTFKGAIGLAPQWASSPLATQGARRWVTACLLQTLNGLGLHVPVRLSGSNPALADEDPSDAAAFSVRDATMFGDVFTLGGRAYACTDVGLIDACGINASLSTVARICGLSPTCGLTLLGPCATRCATGPTGATCVDPVGSSYPESISSTLESSISIQLNPLCN